MSSCRAELLSLRATDASGGAGWDLVIPPATGLIGARLRGQWTARDATANAAGFIASRGLSITACGFR